MAPKAERVGSPQCNDFPTIIHSRTGVTKRSTSPHPNTSKPCGDGERAKQQVEVTTGSCSLNSARRRPDGNSRYLSEPWTTEDFGIPPRRLSSLFRTALLTLARGKGLEKVSQPKLVQLTGQHTAAGSSTPQAVEKKIIKNQTRI